MNTGRRGDERWGTKVAVVETQKPEGGTNNISAIKLAAWRRGAVLPQSPVIDRGHGMEWNKTSAKP
jgi:hypothetical protein